MIEYLASNTKYYIYKKGVLKIKLFIIGNGFASGSASKRSIPACSILIFKLERLRKLRRLSYPYRLVEKNYFS